MLTLFNLWRLKRQLTGLSFTYDQRIEAAEALARLGTPRAATMLTVGLDDVSWEVRAFVKGALTRMGLTAVPSVVSMLRHDHAVIRGEAIDVLMRIGDKRAVASITAFLSDPADLVRLAATDAIQTLNAETPVAAQSTKKPICTQCKCPVYEFSMEETERLMALGPITGNTRVIELISTRCPQCGDVHCAGCARRTERLCPKCGVNVVSTKFG